MKNIILILVLGAFTISCAQEKAAVTNDTQFVVDPTLITQTTQNFGDEYGGSVTLDTDSNTLVDFLQRRTGVITELRLNLSLSKNSNDTFSGTATIRFRENGQARHVTFHTGGQNSSQYNRWIKNGSQFHAIFDDFEHGMLVVTIDEVFDFGDGDGNLDVVNGSVFYFNYDLRSKFGVAVNDHPQFFGEDTYCWQISQPSPYHCSPWANLEQANIQTFPNFTTKSFGKFNGLSLSDTFAETISRERL